MSKLKPFNDDLGYVASRRTAFGWVVLYDRESGGDWIGSPSRWVLLASDETKHTIGVLDCPTRKWARDVMKDTANGRHDWIGQFQEAGS